MFCQELLAILFPVAAVLCVASFISAVPDCPPMWTPWQTACYRLTGQLVTWNQNEALCRDMGAQMAAPHSEEENMFMTDMVAAAGGEWLWVGCKISHTAWKCEGQARGQAYFNWSIGEPTNRDGVIPSTDYCAYIDMYTLGWNDIPCAQASAPQALCVLRSPGQTQPQSFSRSSDQQQLTRCLVDYVNREFITKSASRCASTCPKEPRCHSLDIKGTVEEGNVCQLSDENLD